MALDVGHKRIGVAISDELSLTAQGAETIERKDIDNDLERIDGLVKSYDAEEVVVGFPINMDGTYSQQTKEVAEFIDELSKAIDVPVKTWDERLTSIQADKILLEADVTRRRRKALLDKISAQLILQSYLDNRREKED